VPASRAPRPRPCRTNLHAFPPWRWQPGDGGSADRVAGSHSDARACGSWRRPESERAPGRLLRVVGFVLGTVRAAGPLPGDAALCGRARP
jgi:hypothetical protein